MNVRTKSKDRLEMVRQWCAKYPDRGNHTLAKAIYQKYRKWFPTLDAARCSVRHVRGAIGDTHRKRSVKALHRPLGKSGDYMKMPPSKACPRKVVRLSPGSWLTISDIHIPFHDEAALDAALVMGEQAKVDGVLIDGDMGDFHSISRFLSNPTERNLSAEVKAQRHFLGHLRHRFPKARIVLKKGNHDERWQHYIWQKAPELEGLDATEYGALLHLEEFGVELAGGRTMVQAGKLTVLHGHEVEQGASSPVNPARGLFMRTLDSYLMGHRHRTSEHTEKTANGRFITCWSLGCLCGLWPEYATINKWNHGAAILDVREGGIFTVHNRRIYEGRVL